MPIPYHKHGLVDFLLVSYPAYAILVFLGYVAVAAIILLETRRKRLSYKQSIMMSLVVLAGIMFGSRLFYYFGPWLPPEISFYERFINFLMFWTGGQVLLGGVLGAILFFVLYCRISRIDFWQYADIAGYASALGLFVGRFACFLGGCCYGIETHLPWAIERFGTTIHPTQLYESFGCLVIFIILTELRTRQKYDGQIFIWSVISYSIMRFFLEFMRDYESGLIHGLSASQIVCLLVVPVFFYIAMQKSKSSKKKPRKSKQ